jgi:hypothetical protein
MLAERTDFSLPKMASEMRSAGTTRSMMARASGLAPTRSKCALGLPASGPARLMALMIGWIAWWAKASASTKRSSVIWSAEPSIISMSFSLPT